ncbi:unnamed protein product [Amaranthus hypochondriacus]
MLTSIGGAVAIQALSYVPTLNCNEVFKDAIEALRISYKKMNPFCVPFVTTNMRSAMLAMDLVSCVLLLHKRFCNIIKIAREAEKLRKRKKLDARTLPLGITPVPVPPAIPAAVFATRARKYEKRRGRSIMTWMTVRSTKGTEELGYARSHGSRCKSTEED